MNLLKNIFSVDAKQEHIVLRIFGIKFSIKKAKCKLHFKTFRDLSNVIRENIIKLPSDIDIVVGIPRSGIIPAYMIALFMNKDVCSLDEFINGITPHRGERPAYPPPSSNIDEKRKQKVLIVDDSVHSGNALKKVKEKLSAIDISKYEIEYCCIYATSDSKDKADYYFEIAEQPRMFQWNYLNNCRVEESCFDMDGVLCIDPTDEQNDDGEKYINFILTAKPLFIPSYTIHSIVTSRLEKYRPQTEQWLKEHNVKYKNLYMIDLPSAEERQKLNCHAEFKAKIFSRLRDCKYFIESNRQQAAEIARLSKKTCICSETDECFSI